MRNPLAALRTFGKLLLRRLEELPDALNRDLAADLLTQSERLVTLLLPMESPVELGALEQKDGKNGIEGLNNLDLNKDSNGLDLVRRTGP